MENQQRLIFELMASRDNPSGLFTDFTDDRQLKAYRDMVTALASHLIERYGREVVRQWYFETNNEPDSDTFWSYTIPEFLNDYDAVSEGLKAADPELRFGGPGAASDLPDLLKELLAHCDTGTNYFTGETGVRLDFISVHVKDEPLEMIRRTGRIWEYLKENHPRFTEIPWMNDEADPMIGWGASSGGVPIPGMRRSWRRVHTISSSTSWTCWEWTSSCRATTISFSGAGASAPSSRGSSRAVGSRSSESPCSTCWE